MKLQSLLSANGFRKIDNDGSYPPSGELFEVPKDMAIGKYWIYVEEGLFNIKIHDFYYQEDTVFQLNPGNWPRCLSITYYDSVSGEEFGPYRQMSSGCIKTFFGGDSQFKCVFHKNIPFRSIGIEILPAFYENYLCALYGKDYVDPTDAFMRIGQTSHFPKLVTIFKQIWHYRGTGMAARLFYRSKIEEIIVAILEYDSGHNSGKNSGKTLVTEDEMRSMNDVADYINGHFNTKISLEHLSNIAYMSTTKLKKTFKLVYKMTITEYIRERRMSQAENLLSSTTLPVEQVAIAVGYKNAGRFASEFKTYSGMYPSAYRTNAMKP